MNSSLAGWAALDHFLTTDAEDAGCAEAFVLLDVWAELVTLGARPEEHLPRLGAHLRTCGACFEDLTGLLQMMTLLSGGKKPPLPDANGA